MGVISWTAGQALWVLLAGQRDRHCGCYWLDSWTGTVGVISWTAGQAMWVLLAGQRDRHCGCY